ncbi:helix-turn-helix transcriptional regulator [Streptomyces sp. SID12488]|uniref:helix-turn-helix domain-containing protein n=1 Tax=Streptomyces sp. SID12488 TaxID=2706040 RepID=UPI0013DA968F|nr:helix-turn-helix transcriptional regulator [Streptomyces sp. SID12488]NEA62024.1 helix-turn-helix domain-containing protein [Streptomyces sp. SID12488]
MTVGAGQSGSGTEDQDWDGDESTADLLKTVGKQVKLWRERAGLTQAELGAAIGYSEEQVSSVERGRRVPKPGFLDAADEALGAGGLLAAFKEDVERARYPRKVRDLAKLEAEAAQLGAYASAVVHGLLQTPDYAQSLYRLHRPMLDEDTIERSVSARMARQEIFSRWPAPILSFVQEEVTLRRPVGGRMVLRGQLERLLEVGQLRNVEIQVMPIDREDHAGLGGSFMLIDPRTGPKVGHAEVQQFSRVVADRKEVRRLDSLYGIIRAQALTPRESLAFIEKVLGET